MIGKKNFKILGKTKSNFRATYIYNVCKTLLSCSFSAEWSS
jgi:hypothetical protein